MEKEKPPVETIRKKVSQLNDYRCGGFTIERSHAKGFTIERLLYYCVRCLTF